MELIRDLLLFVHLLGFASLLGGALVQVRAQPRVVNDAMLHGALTALLAGVLLVGLLESMPDASVDRVKIAVKLVVALVVAVLCWVNRKKPAIPAGLFFGLLGLSALNAAIAVFWH